jgi:tripartite-type tricarboxylate transporter receptor subunit TctC
MPLSRRRFVQIAGGLALAAASPRLARAEAYPSRPVRLIVGFPPGGPADIGARLIGQYLQEMLGQPFLVENRPGAASNVATEAVVRSAPDGYTLTLCNSSQSINATLYDKLSYNFVRDIAPVACIYQQPLIVVVTPSLPVKTLTEFIAYAKANPGRVNMASGGIGSPQHAAGELLKMMAGVDLLHVPYRGAAPALTDLIGGQVQIMIEPVSSSIEHVKSGKLRALAVTAPTPWAALPDLPVVGEVVPGYEVVTWSGIGAPRGTPAGIVEKLNRVINEGLADPKLKSRFDDIGVSALPLSPDAFATLIGEDTVKWAKVVKFSGAKVE